MESKDTRVLLMYSGKANSPASSALQGLRTRALSFKVVGYVLGTSTARFS
jgi:hypothetical protein